MEWLRGGNVAARTRAAELLRRGKLVAVPTETVYGLAALAEDESAVRKIFSVKGRPLLDPLIVHLGSFEQVEGFCEVNPVARALAERFWPGPLTLVLPRRADCPIPDLVSAGKPTLGVRIPAHPLLRKLLCESQIPLAAPSANPFGYVSPTRPEHVATSLTNGVDAILDGGPCEHGLESTILNVSAEGEVRLLRPGPLSSEEILRVPDVRSVDSRRSDSSRPDAPGMLKSHYRPRKPVHLFPKGEFSGDSLESEAVVFLKRPTHPRENDFWFSESGQAEEIGRNLFDLLRQLDAHPTFASLRIETPISDTGIWRAIRDRLQRAATPPD